MPQQSDGWVGGLLERLIATESFEDAALIALEAALRLADRGVRASVHLRPEGDYRGLAVLERGAAALCTPGEDDTLPSATAWRWIVGEGAPVLVDVTLGRARVASNEPTESEHARTFDGAASLVRLQRRGSTHLLAVPLRAPGGKITGMITVELATRDATTEVLSSSSTEQLELLANIVAPYLYGLPLGRAAVPPGDPLLPVVGAAMTPVIHLLRVFARLEETILLSGPTGSGKSRLAEWCHANGPQFEGPFVTLDIHTVPEATQMGELFGWRRGAFTGAADDNPGYVARAEHGTLFLDEIDKLSLGAQSALLGLLETKRYRMLGDPEGARTANVRFLIGTNVDLAEAVRQGTFREDLYYRINVLPVRVLSLDQRRDEIARWATFMVDRRHRRAVANGYARFSSSAGERLERQVWPGNLRQLDNVVRRAYAMLVAEVGDVPSEAVIEDRHVDRALLLEQTGESTTLLTTMRRAADAFVDEAVRRSSRGVVLDLDHTASFRGLVLEAALARLNERKAVYELFGRSKSVQNRNYVKEIRRELDRLDEFAGALDEHR